MTKEFMRDEKVGREGGRAGGREGGRGKREDIRL
jgi:hypothetical protein